jgi:hypothetical protein
MLPIELEIDTYPTETLDEIDNLVRRTYDLITELPETLIDAKKAIQRSQRQQKQRHDNRLPPYKPLNIGDKVWLERKTHDGKFAPKWLGPFYIHDVLDNSAYRLRKIHSGEVLKNTYHGTRLKLVIEEAPLEPLVVV